MSEVKLCSPVEPYEMDKHLRRQMQELADRVAGCAAANGMGRDLILRIYMAGIYHGVELSKRTLTTPHQDSQRREG